MTLVGTVRKNKQILPANMQAHKERAVYSSNFAFSKEATVCSYVPKKNKAVIMLSSLHMSPIIQSNKETAKPEIILYYNKTKSGVNNMDKLLAEYTVKRRTNRWPLALFYNIIDIAALAAYIIYMEHNPQLVSSDRRRKFLKSLSLQLCGKNIEERSKNCIVTSKLHVRSAMQDVLGQELRPSISFGYATYKSQTRRDSTGRVAVVGSCYLYRELKRKQRKTRKACTNCRKPVCDEHAVTRPTCNICFERCN
ncbi:unnamed protein product [Parnassius mnemosyne]|uniref:PiggyBac transposable element-derived protein domain-containing protein n=1 Tax=Parnassius mnemosyne TaxID=213953 RepID=A0AAV1LLA7_9NEOP